jgi:branched-chain amino acid transport system substrate-binding protein
MSAFNAAKIFVGVTLALALSACSEDAPPAATPEPATPAVASEKPAITVTLGHVVPLTGPLAHLGKDHENGAALAIEDLNDEKLEIGGARVTFVLSSEDDVADFVLGSVAARKLIGEKIHGVVGHLNSGSTLPAISIYHDAGVPLVTAASTTPAITQQGFHNIFRVIANDDQQGKGLGEFAIRLTGAKRVAVLSDHTQYGQGLAERFQKTVTAAGIKVVYAETFQDTQSDFSTQLGKIKAWNPDLVFFAGMDVQAAPLLKQAREAGIKARFLSGDGACSLELIVLAGTAASEGYLCSKPGQPLEAMPKGEAFEGRYKLKYKQEIQLYAPYAYDAIMTIADAMRRAGSTSPERYMPELAKTDFPGVTDRIHFDANGDLQDPAISLYQVRNGKLRYMDTIGGTYAANDTNRAAAPKTPILTGKTADAAAAAIESAQKPKSDESANASAKKAAETETSAPTAHAH